MSAVCVIASFAPLQAARAKESARPVKLGISDDAGAAISQMDKTLAAVPLSTIAFARGAGGDTHGRGFAGGAHVHGGLGGGHMGDGLVGGSFAWPYYDYCTRHPLTRTVSTPIGTRRTA